jgi:hypothetical protein
VRSTKDDKNNPSESPPRTLGDLLYADRSKSLALMNQARSRAIDRLRFEQRRKRVDPHPDRTLTAQGEPGSADERIWTETGCTCLLVTSLEDRIR